MLSSALLVSSRVNVAVVAIFAALRSTKMIRLVRALDDIRQSSIALACSAAWRSSAIFALTLRSCSLLHLPSILTKVIAFPNNPARHPRLSLDNDDCKHPLRKCCRRTTPAQNLSMVLDCHKKEPRLANTRGSAGCCLSLGSCVRAAIFCRGVEDRRPDGPTKPKNRAPFHSTQCRMRRPFDCRLVCNPEPTRTYLAGASRAAAAVWRVDLVCVANPA